MTVADARPRGRSRAPVHLWIVGVLALLWTAMGCVDYLATQTQWEPYMSQGDFTEAELAYFYGFPAWVVALWAFAVWGGFLGSIALLLRKSWAVWLYGLSLLGLAGTTVYSYLLSEGGEIMGTFGAIFTLVIWIVALFLFWYAREQTKKGVLV